MGCRACFRSVFSGIVLVLGVLNLFWESLKGTELVLGVFEGY